MPLLLMKRNTEKERKNVKNKHPSDKLKNSQLIREGSSHYSVYPQLKKMRTWTEIVLINLKNIKN